MYRLGVVESVDLESMYKCIDMASIQQDPHLVARVQGASIWSFTGNCGPFGTARGTTTHGLTGLADPESSAYTDMLLLLGSLNEEARPKCILLENIKAFVSNSDRLKNKSNAIGDGVWWLHQLADLGFYIEVHIPNVLTLEVAQKRERAMVVCFKSLEHHRAWIQMGAPRPVSCRPQLHTIFQGRNELGAGDVSRYTVDRRQVDLYSRTVGLKNGHVVVTRQSMDPGPTLRASYQVTRSIPKVARREIPYGMYLSESCGSMRMLTEVECGLYMGMNQREAECLPLGADSYFALGNAVIVHVAEQFVHQALECMEVAVRAREMGGTSLETAPTIGTVRRPELVRVCGNGRDVRTIWVTR